MRRVLVTGGAGFIGANLVRRLVCEGHETHLLHRPGGTRWRLDGVPGVLHVHEAQLADPAAVERVIAVVRPEWVFHLAAYGGSVDQADVREMMQTNLLGTVNLVEACLRTGVEALVNTGSSSEYGFKNHAPAESERLEPNSHYAVTKAAATLFCRYTAQSRGVHLPTLRLYSVYGPWEAPGRLFPTLIRCGLRGTLPPLARPETARDFVYVDDVTDAYLHAASRGGQRPGAIYNIGTGVATTLRDVVTLARRTLGVATEPAWCTLADRPWDTPVWVAAPASAQAQLGWRPHWTLDAGFRQMVEWFRTHPAVWTRYDADRVAGS